jgi:hypothetical protein
MLNDNQGGNGGSSSGNSISLAWDPLDDLMSETTTYTSGSSYSGSATYTYDYAGRLVGLTGSQNGNSASYLYCYDPDNELKSIFSGAGVTCTSGNPLTALLYDLDGNRLSLTESTNGGSVVTNYNNYDADNRPGGQSFTGNGNSLGGLSYTWDNDDRLTLETGSLASLKMPPTTSSISYTGTNQIAAWNGVASQYDAASNLTFDPASSDSLIWDERNLMSSVSGGPAGSFTMQYDAKGRRENDTGANTGTNYYLDSGKTVVLGNNVSGGNQTLNSYVTLPGTGEVVGFSALGGLAPQGPSNPTPMVPLHDVNGSTLGITYGSNNTIGAQWSYEPFGTPYQSGAQVSYPFLFEGMQLDPTGYYGDYSPRLAHSLSGGGTAYNGAGNSGGGGSARRMRSSSRANGAIANDTFFCGNGDCASGGQPQDFVSPQDINAFVSGLKSLGRLLSQFFGGLFGGASHPYKPSPAKFAPAHSLLAVKIGVPKTIAVTNAIPEYPMGAIQPIAWNDQYTQGLKVPKPQGPEFHNRDNPHAELRQAPTRPNKPQCPQMSIPQDWADPVSAGIMAFGFAGFELGGFYGGIAGGAAGALMGMYTYSYLNYGCE